MLNSWKLFFLWEVLILERIYSAQERKKLMRSDHERISVDLFVILERIYFLWEEFISVDKKSMCSDTERISVNRFVILERIYFPWEELISVQK